MPQVKFFVLFAGESDVPERLNYLKTYKNGSDFDANVRIISRKNFSKEQDDIVWEYLDFSRNFVCSVAKEAVRASLKNILARFFGVFSVIFLF